MSVRSSAGALACVMGDMDMVRPLGLAGIPCIVVTQPGEPPLYSRFTRAALRWNDFWEGAESLVEALVRFGAAQSDPPVLFYQKDSQLLLVSRHRERLGQAFRFVIPDPTLVEDLVDKGRFQALAEHLHLPVPAAQRVSPTTDSSPPEVELPFPVIVKPLVRHTAWWDAVHGSGKALQIDTPDALRELWPRLAATGLEFLIQELVPGPETRVESYHTYVDEHGDIVGEFTGRKIRTLPASYGHSTALTITDSADVAELGRALVRQINLRGVAKFDFKRAPDGRLYLLEVNSRFNLWHHLGASAGVNLPALVYADLVGLPRAAERRARPGACWCRPLKDRLAARESGVPLRAWLPWALRCEAKSITLDDPMPYLRNWLFRRRRGRVAGGRGIRAAEANGVVRS